MIFSLRRWRVSPSRAVLIHLPKLAVACRVVAAQRQQLRMRAALDDASPVERQHEVGLVDGAQAVRDDETRAAAQRVARLNAIGPALAAGPGLSARARWSPDDAIPDGG